MSNKPTILFADDDADDRELFLEAVCEIDPSVICNAVSSGLEVINFLEMEKAVYPHIIFLDINMPLMNGWDCLKTLKANTAWRSIPVIMYSTAGRVEVDRAIELGAICLFTKPDSYTLIYDILNAVIKNHEGDLKVALQDFPNIKF